MKSLMRIIPLYDLIPVVLNKVIFSFEILCVLSDEF